MYLLVILLYYFREEPAQRTILLGRLELGECLHVDWQILWYAINSIKTLLTPDRVASIKLFLFLASMETYERCIIVS